MGEGITRELAYTGRKFDAAEAKRNRPGQPRVQIAGRLYAGVREIAATIICQVKFCQFAAPRK